MSERDAKVIGCFAYSSPSAVVCTGDACVITGSEEAMRAHLKLLGTDGAQRYTVRKTRFGEIMKGLSLGAAYGFGEEAYGRFLPLGRQEGLALADADFSRRKEHFFTVQLKRL